VSVARQGAAAGAAVLGVGGQRQVVVGSRRVALAAATTGQRRTPE